MQVDRHYPRNAKNLARVGYAGPREMVDPLPDNPNNTRYYHPTKGWRTVSVKRSRASAVNQSGLPARGHAIKRIIREGY